MKEINLLFAYASIFSISLSSCQKDKEMLIENKNVQINEIRVVDNLLKFESLETFDNVVNFISEENDERFYSHLKSLNFNSYANQLNFSDSTNQVDDLFLANILNPDFCVEIGDWIFKINKPNEKVFALKSENRKMYPDLVNENISNKHILQFSTEDDIFELLGERPKALSKNCQSSNEKNNNGWFEYADYVDENNVYGNGKDKRYKFSVWLRVRYDNWGIYRKLFTEFKHKEAWGGTFDETYVSIAFQVQYYQKNSSASNNVTHYPSYSFATNPLYSGTSNYEYYTKNKEVIHYRETKCLGSYVLKSWCWFRDRKTLTPRLYPNNGCLRIEGGGLGSVYPC